MRTFNCLHCDRGDEPIKVSTWRVHVLPDKTGAICAATYFTGVKVLVDDECRPGEIWFVDTRYCPGLLPVVS